MERHSIREALFNKRMLICIFTGFTSGLPLYILIQLVPAWLRKEGVSLTEIGLFALVGIPYNWKFLWAPMMDRFFLPILGRRRTWMLATQVALMVSIACTGLIDPKLSLGSVAWLAGAIAFFSASQDVVLDGYRRELLPDHELGLGNSIHVQTYRLSGLIPGALALILADRLPWESVFFIVAAFMLVGIILTLVISEAIEAPPPPKTYKEVVIEPFAEFVKRQKLADAALILAFLFFYKLGDNMAVALATPFYIDLGFSLTEIGLIAKNAALWPSIIGGMLGGIWMVRLGINRALWVFGVVQIVTILGYVVLAEAGANKLILAVVVGMEYLGVGLGTAALTAFMARATSKVFAATQFALFSALATLPRTFASAATGYLVDQMGWTTFFVLCTCLAIPGMTLLFWVAPWKIKE
jgi:PAT family beta-lactamase induction signal transducer AmpG